MNSLEAMMGLDPNGVPFDAGYPQDPMLQYGAEDDEAMMMAEMGMPPMEDPYTLAGMEMPQGLDEGQLLAQQMLGGPSPQLGQAEINMLAQNLGLAGQNGIVVGEMADPMYSPRFDTMSLMGGY